MFLRLFIFEFIFFSRIIRFNLIGSFIFKNSNIIIFALRYNKNKEKQFYKDNLNRFIYILYKIVNRKYYYFIIKY